MLLLFLDIKEKPEVKKKIARKLSELEKKIRKSNKEIARVIFTDAKKIRDLNKFYRKNDKDTDVLSFAELDTKNKFLKEEKTLGEIYINYDWIKNGKREFVELFIHGYLHLIGYDHEKDQGEMKKLEKKLRELV